MRRLGLLTIISTQIQFKCKRTQFLNEDQICHGNGNKNHLLRGGKAGKKSTNEKRRLLKFSIINVLLKYQQTFT